MFLSLNGTVYEFSSDLSSVEGATDQTGPMVHTWETPTPTCPGCSEDLDPIHLTAFSSGHVYLECGACGNVTLPVTETCPNCEGRGFYVFPTRLKDFHVACTCVAGIKWERKQEAIAERENDPHERASARARGNDFEATNGRDWT